jgi:hypothetical protein
VYDRDVSATNTTFNEKPMELNGAKQQQQRQHQEEENRMRILTALTLGWCSALTRAFAPQASSSARSSSLLLLNAGGGPFDIFNAGKKAFVKSLAGDYDATAVRTKIDNLIKNNSVLMLSFTT